MRTSLSEVPLDKNCVLVFDLDDTLFAERDFVYSGFREVAYGMDPARVDELQNCLQLSWSKGELDPIGTLLDALDATASKADMLQIFRSHLPTIKLDAGLLALLRSRARAKHPLGILTDGRVVTQQNKIEALGLTNLIDEVVISERFGSSKPSERNYRHFEQVFPGRHYAYIGDNIAKDFVTPNRLGWTTIGLLDRGANIHPQRFEQFPNTYHPQYLIHSIA